MPALKYRRDFTHQQTVSFAHSNSVDAAKSSGSFKSRAASTPAEFKQNQCASMGIGMGPRIHEVCPFSAVNHSYAAVGESSLDLAISAAYKQVFGNISVYDSQRLTSLEAFLRDGRIKIQGFMAGLVKSELYKSKFFYAVSPIRGIELTTKHLLGRPPIDQGEIGSAVKFIADNGFDAFVDSLVTSEEYLETFGTDTVPYLRGFKSEARASCSTFLGMAEVTPANAASENAMGGMSLLVSYLNKGVKLRAPAFVADSGPFSYSRAVGDARNAAFQRMYGGKFSYRY